MKVECSGPEAVTMCSESRVVTTDSEAVVPESASTGMEYEGLQGHRRDRGALRDFRVCVQNFMVSLGRDFAVVGEPRVCVLHFKVSDHEHALKVLHTLDPTIWEIKVSSIIESTSYDTLTISELFSKLKATEVDTQLRSNLTGSGSKSLALATPSTDPSSVSCARFSLMSITEDHLESLGDDDLCLFNNRVRRVYDKRMFKIHGTKSGCFECGDPGHFIADCPKRNGHKKGTGGGFNDSSKHDSSSFNKGKPKTRFFRKALKDYRRENKKRDKAFFAEMEKSYSKRSTSSSSSSSSSDEEIVIRKAKDKDDPAGLCFMDFGDRPKSRSHQR
ncbi:hypothetical protein GUJ93_ZPchr0012g22068 [Zizania palustris]|uniref:CCHC-type domain-containing protein n=1 Tax=Zizania palustris TaxID=103762 RepID=A0A8J5WQC9_ZIZPA|nr:hypothetical protein GUJ93_ZPchr0012g22068 [Zizania palustris]